MLRVALVASTVFNLRWRMDCRTVMLHKDTIFQSGTSRFILLWLFDCQCDLGFSWRKCVSWNALNEAGRKSKISRLKIILFRGDVSVFGVVIHIARHSIGIKNTTHSLALYYSWEFFLLANSFLIQTVESTSEISLMDQHEISEVDPKWFCMSKCWFHSGAW